MTIIEAGAGIADARVREGLPGIRIEHAQRTIHSVVTSRTRDRLLILLGDGSPPSREWLALVKQTAVSIDLIVRANRLAG